jgi:UDP-N-acetylglucosamine transferase subunit ALG13
VKPGYNKSLLLVTVGGDHHPFDRLMRWVEDWLVDEGDRVRCVVQHGPARPPAGTEATPYIPYDQMRALMAEARAVVSSGGPATLAEARQLGHRPVAVPRLTALGEAVDDHQRAFTTRLHDLGYVLQAETEAAFRMALDTALDTPRIAPAIGELAPVTTITRIGELIEATASNSRRSRRGGWADARYRTSAGH